MQVATRTCTTSSHHWSQVRGSCGYQDILSREVMALEAMAQGPRGLQCSPRLEWDTQALLLLHPSFVGSSFLSQNYLRGSP